MARSRESEAAVHGLCEEHDVLDISTLVAAGALERGTRTLSLPGVAVRLDVRTVEKDAAIDVNFGGGGRTLIEFAWTPCGFGGRRPWLRCPDAECGGRRGRLYWVGHTWRCRSCAGLRYQSQRLRPIERGLAKAGRIRAQLGGEPFLAAPFPPRPKSMEFERYEQLRDQVHEAEMAYALHVGDPVGSYVETVTRRLEAMESASRRKPSSWV
jgi:hypothetical protein